MMTIRKIELGEIIATRKSVFTRSDSVKSNVVVNLGKPVPDPDDPDRTWICPFQILGIGSEHTKAIFGTDSLQALILALHILPTELAALAKKENGSFDSREQDLGLSSACKTHLHPSTA
jgi:hypothetical protein